MDNLCEYCKTPYIPKRSDALYCSQSCKQSAYVLRKADSLHGLRLGSKSTYDETQKSMLSLIGIGHNYPSAEPEETVIGQKNLTGNTEDSSIYPSVEHNKTPIGQNYLTDKPEATDNYPSGMTDKEAELTSALTDSDIETGPIAAKQGEYKAHHSSFLTEITEIVEERNYVGSMDHLLYTQDSGLCWVSTRYKCFLECLLLFSEMKTIEGDDLKELCNAFTHLVYSPCFHSLPEAYPYTTEILKLREKLKSICLNLEPNGKPFPFTLQRITRQKFLASRWELSNHFPKVSFNELDFT